MADEKNDIRIKILADKAALAKFQADAKAALEQLKSSNKAMLEQMKIDGKAKLEFDKNLNRQSLADTRAIEKEKQAAVKQSVAQQKADSKLTGQTSVLGSAEHLAGLKAYARTLSATDPALKSTNARIKEMTASLNAQKVQAKMSSAQLLEMGENITVVAYGISQLISGLKNAATGIYDFALAGAKFGEMRKYFEEVSGGVQQAAEKMELLRTAAAGTLDDKQLIGFTNKMGDLGYNTNQTAQILDLAETISDKLGTTLEEGADKLLRFIETGKGKGLYQLGISLSDVSVKMRELSELTDEEIKKLDEDAKQKLRSIAVLQLYGNSLENIKQKQKDNADSIESIVTAFTNFKLKVGEIVGNILAGMSNAFGTNTKNIIEMGVALGGLLATITAVGLAITLLKTAMAALTLSSGGLIAVLGGLIAIGAALVVVFSNTEVQLKATNKSYLEGQKASEQYKNVLSALGLTAETTSEAIKLMTDNVDRMTNAQIIGAIKLVEAEKQKLLAYEKEAQALTLLTMQQEAFNNVSTGDKLLFEVKFKNSLVPNVAGDIAALNASLTIMNSQLVTLGQSVYTKGNVGTTGKGSDIEKVVEYSDELIKKTNELKELQDAYDLSVKNNAELWASSNGQARFFTKQLEDIAKLQKEITELKEREVKLNEIIIKDSLLINPEEDTLKRQGAYGVSGNAYPESTDPAIFIMNMGLAFEGMQQMVDGIANIFQSIMQGLGIAADSFIGKLINGFNSVSSIIQSLVQTIQLVQEAGGILKTIGAIFGLASGGEANAGQPYFVGERGTELFIPSTSGYVMNNGNLNKLINNVSVNRSNNANIYLSANMDALKIYASGKKAYNQKYIKLY